MIQIWEDAESLTEWNRLNRIDTIADEAAQAEYAKLTQDLPIRYTIRSYQSSAAIGKSGILENNMEQTIYETTNILKEEIAPEAVKGTLLTQADLTFYIMLSEEEKNAMLSFIEEKEEF